MTKQQPWHSPHRGMPRLLFRQAFWKLYERHKTGAEIAELCKWDLFFESGERVTLRQSIQTLAANKASVTFWVFPVPVLRDIPLSWQKNSWEINRKKSGAMILQIGYFFAQKTQKRAHFLPFLRKIQLLWHRRKERIVKKCFWKRGNIKRYFAKNTRLLKKHRKNCGIVVMEGLWKISEWPLSIWKF